MPTIGVVRWQPANRLPIVYRLRCPALSSVTKHLPRSPTAAHTALALDSAAGGGVKGKLVAMVGMTVDLAVAVEESLK